MDKNPKQKNKREKQKMSKSAKSKAILASVAVGTCCVMLLTGCGNANNANAAARMGNNTAKRADNIVKKLDTYEDAHYKFPTAFGGDFFVKDHDYANDFYFKSVHTKEVQTIEKQPRKLSERMKMKSLQRRASRQNAKPTSVNAGTMEGGRYMARHYESNRLNQENAGKKAYIDRYDDLYMLCADISAANAKQDKLISEIRGETTQLRQNAGMVYGQNKKIKKDWSEFNKAHADTQKAMTMLYRDRNAVGKSLRVVPKKMDNVHPEKLSMRYQVIMNKLDCRIDKLEATKDGLCRMNKALAANSNHSANFANIHPKYPLTAKHQLNKTNSNNAQYSNYTNKSPYELHNTIQPQIETPKQQLKHMHEARTQNEQPSQQIFQPQSRYINRQNNVSPKMVLHAPMIDTASNTEQHNSPEQQKVNSLNTQQKQEVSKQETTRPITFISNPFFQQARILSHATENNANTPNTQDAQFKTMEVRGHENNPQETTSMIEQPQRPTPTMQPRIQNPQCPTTQQHAC